jgi:ParB family transcriptional regulator, chromosome partitioning protein
MALGKSLDSILGDYFGDEVVTLDKKQQVQVTTLETRADSGDIAGSIVSLPVDIIEPSPYQSRTTFDDEKILSLAKSIKKGGLIHPIVVLQKLDGGYMLIAGERRLRAIKSLGHKEILAIVKQEKSLSESQHSLLTAMENLQREDLNPIELADTYVVLMQTQNLDEDGLGKLLQHSTQYVRNYLRLLKLSLPVKEALVSRKIGEGQARHLIGLSEEKQKELLDLIIQKDLTVREIAEVLKNSKNKLKQANKFIPNYHKVSNVYFKKAQALAANFPGSKLKVSGDDNKGKILISWG